MKKATGITVATVLAMGIAGGSIMALGNMDPAKAASDDTASAVEASPRLLAQAPSVAPSAPAESDPAPAVSADDTDTTVSSEVSPEDAARAPESTQVTAHLVKADGTSASGGAVYFVFQNRLNEIPHTDPLDKVKAMAEAAVAVDSEGSFTLKMKPGNFAMIYDPAAQDVDTAPGPESMAVIRRLTKDQVQARIAAIKENAMKGLPIVKGKIGEAFVVENRFIRPPISNFGELQLQSDAAVVVKALDEKGELINFPATLRLRGKNGDIMEPHTPSVTTRAQYEFYDLMPQSYQVFALGTLPRPGAGDEISTPTVSNDQFIYTGEKLDHEVVVKPTDKK